VEVGVPQQFWRCLGPVTDFVLLQIIDATVLAFAEVFQRGGFADIHCVLTDQIVEHAIGWMLAVQ